MSVNSLALTSLELSSMVNYGYFIRPLFVRSSLCLSIIQRAAQRASSIRPAMAGEPHPRLDHNVRTDRIAWITEQEEPEVHNRFRRLGFQMEKQLRIALNRFDVQYAVYESAPLHGFSGYVRHVDSVASQTNPRRLTAVLYLNRCKGGQLRLFLKQGGDPLDVAPEQGLLCVFRSELIEHEVLPVESERYALTAWYY